MNLGSHVAAGGPPDGTAMLKLWVLQATIGFSGLVGWNMLGSHNDAGAPYDIDAAADGWA